MATKTSKKPYRKPPRRAGAPHTFQHDPRIPPVGTTMRKMWGHRNREIKVLVDGFEYKGDHYDSLSKVWCVIKSVDHTNGFVDQGLVQRIGGKVRDVESVSKEYGPAAADFNAIAEEVGIHAIPPSFDKVLVAAGLADVNRLQAAAVRLDKGAQALRHASKLLAVRVGKLPTKATG